MVGLPSPTPEAVLLVALFRDMPATRCSKRMKRLTGHIRTENPRVTVLRAMVPALDDARDGADAILRAVCVVCSKRDSCPGPLQ